MISDPTTPDEAIQLPSNRVFGGFFTCIGLTASVFFGLGGHVQIAIILLTLALLLFGCTLVRPDALAPLNRLWMKFGELLGRIVSPVILGILFLTVFTLPAIGMRLAGRDSMGRKPTDQPSYWHTRPADQRTTRFTEQY